MSMASVACPIVGQELLKGCSCSCLSPTSKISCASSAGQVVFLDLSSALTDQVRCQSKEQPIVCVLLCVPRRAGM